MFPISLFGFHQHQHWPEMGYKNINYCAQILSIFHFIFYFQKHFHPSDFRLTRNLSIKGSIPTKNIGINVNLKNNIEFINNTDTTDNKKMIILRLKGMI